MPSRIWPSARTGCPRSDRRCSRPTATQTSLTPRRIGWLGLVGLQQQPRALLVVRAVVRDPGLAENLPAEAAGVVRRSLLPGVLQELRVGPLDLERVRRGAEADHRAAAIEVVDDVLHLGVGKILEAQEDDQEVGGLERLEPGDVRAARLDEAGLRVGREEHAALEAVVLRQDPRQRRQRFLGAVLVVAGEEDDVLAARPGPCRLGRRPGADSAPRRPAIGSQKSRTSDGRDAVGMEHGGNSFRD